jgi:phage terminase large subunit
MEEKEGFTFKSTYKHNEFLTPEDKYTLEKYKTIDEYYYQVYCLGNWGNISKSKVFSNVIIEDFEYTPDQLQNVRYGMDFGFVHASTLMGSGYRDGDLYIFLEHYYQEHTNGQFIEKVEKTRFDQWQEITADSAEPDRIREWMNAGYQVSGAKKGKNSLKDGVDYLQNIPKIHIHKSRCPNAAKEFLGFKRRELKDGTITEQFVELRDDTIAAVRYANEEFWNDEYSVIGRYK